MAAYPRKQTVMVFVACLIVVMGVYFYVRTGPVNGRLSNQKGSAATVNAAPQLPNEQIVSGYDWKKDFIAITGPLEVLKATTTQKQSAVPENLSNTELLGRSFLTRYGELKQAGLTQDGRSVSSAVNQVMTDALSNLPAPEIFTKQMLKQSGDTYTEAAAYGKTLTEILAAYIPRDNEAEIANRAFANNDMSELATIDPIISSYTKMLVELKALPVPASVSSYHIDLMNSVALALYNAQSFRNIENDPLRGLAAVQLEIPALEGMAEALNGIQKYLSLKGVKI